MAKKSLMIVYNIYFAGFETRTRSDTKLAVLIQGYSLLFRIQWDMWYIYKKKRGSRGNVRVGSMMFYVPASVRI